VASKLINISEQIHATALELYGNAILLRGEPGSGKSDLALRLIHEGAKLISDDRVELTYKKTNFVRVHQGILTVLSKFAVLVY